MLGVGAPPTRLVPPGSTTDEDCVLAVSSGVSTDNNIWLIRDYWCLPTQSFYVTSFFMFANTCLHVTSQHHDVMSTLIAIQCAFTVRKLSISENRPCRSHRCPADTNNVMGNWKVPGMNVEYICSKCKIMLTTLGAV